MLLVTTGLTNISYADCTTEEKEAKAKLIQENASGKVSSSDMNDLIAQANQAADLANAGRLNEACQKYDDIIARYDLDK